MYQRFAAALAVILFGVWSMGAATGGYTLMNWGTADPVGSCTKDSGIYVNTSDARLWVCPSTTWVRLAGSDETGGGATIPAGSILMVDTGTCPAGFNEVTALNGKTLVGTLAANGNVGGTGGADNITPAGTNGAPSFTGSAWSPPAIAWPAGVPTGATSGAGSAHTHGTGTFANVASATSGNCAATNIAAGTGSTTACKATAPNLTVTAQGHTGALATENAHTHSAGAISWPAGVPTIATYTPAGTVGAPSFTGTQFDNRSAFARVIFCKKS